MLSEEDIRNALRACFDSTNPWRRPLDIVSLGLVESIILAVDSEAPGAGIPGVPLRQSLTVGLIPVTRDADANALLLAQVDNLLAGQPGLSRRTLRLLDEPAWSAARVGQELRRSLQADPLVFPILNNR